MNIEKQAQYLIADNLIDLDAAVVELLKLRAFHATVAAAFLALEHGLRPELFRTPETHAAVMAILSETRAQLGIQEPEETK